MNKFYYRLHKVDNIPRTSQQVTLNNIHTYTVLTSEALKFSPTHHFRIKEKFRLILGHCLAIVLFIIRKFSNDNT